MAKAYKFIITVRQAEPVEVGSRFNPSIIFGASDTQYASIEFDGTLAEALAETDKVLAAETRPAAVMLGLHRSVKRAPAGFKNITSCMFTAASYLPREATAVA